MTRDTDAHAIDLTQLSSREQLSALMDGALPADQTRFLLRRLRHDAPLAECWERWRITGEVMRGLAPARRLPADFPARVAAAVAAPAAQAASTRSRASGRWSWGGGAAVAASLAMAVLLLREPGGEVPLAEASPVATARAEVGPASAPALPVVLQAPEPSAGLARAATPPAAAARRGAAPADPPRSRLVAAAAGDDVPVSPQPDIAARPWPRSALPRYGAGEFAVGFGATAVESTPYNPFQARPGIDQAPAAADDPPQPPADPAPQP